MDLTRVKDEEKIRLCRIYFLGGLPCLPFIWLVNVLWFARDAFVRENYEGQKEIRKYVTWSGVGCSMWIVALVAWQYIYQSNRVSWGATGDYLTFTLPTGRP